MAVGVVDVEVKVKGMSDVAKLTKRLDALENQTRDLAKQNTVLTNKLQASGNAAAGSAGKFGQLATGLVKAAIAFATIQKAAQLAGNAISEAIGRDSAEKKLSLLSKAYGEQAETAELAASSAKKFGLSQTEATEAIAQAYGRLRPLDVSLKDIESTFSGFNTAARLSGASATEAAGSFRQLAQALGSGALRGDEFVSISENAPGLLVAIAKETNMAAGELKDFAADGKLTADIVIKALKRIEREGADALAESLNTPEQKLIDLQNATEDLNVAFGNLILPEVISLVEGLTAAIEGSTKVAKAMEPEVRALVEGLKVMVDILSDAVDIFPDVDAGFIQMAGGLDVFIQGIVNGIPIVRELYYAIKALQSLGGGVDKQKALQQLRDDPFSGKKTIGNFDTLPDSYYRKSSPRPTGGGGGGGASRAPRESNAPELQRELQLEQQLFGVQQKIREAELQGDEQLEIRLQGTAELLKLKNEEAEILANKDLYPEERELELALLGVKVRDQMAETTAELAQLEKDRLEAIESAAQPIQDEIKMLQARLAGTEDIVAAEMEIARLREQGVANAAGLVGQRNELKQQVEQMAETEKMAGDIAGGIASEFTGAFKSIIDGSKSAEEAVKDMLQGIANKFLDIAMQILTDALTQQLTSLFTGLLGGGLGGGGGGGFNLNPLGGLSFLAEGGFVTGPTQAWIGEGGESEYVVPSSKMDSAMQRYNSGMRGDAVVSGASANGDSNEGGQAGGGGSAGIDVSYNVTSINGMSFITEEQFQRGMSKAASDGARMGEARALGRLRTSTSARSKIGL